MDITQFIRQLEETGFFEWAKPEERENVKARLFEQYQNSGKFNFVEGLNQIFAILPDTPYESEGPSNIINALKEQLAVLGIDLQIGEYVEIWGEFEYEERHIEIDGKKYNVLGENAFEAILRVIAEILHDHNRTEKIYHLRGTEIAYILLKEHQFRLFDALSESEITSKPVDLNAPYPKIPLPTPESALLKIKEVREKRLPLLDFSDETLTHIPEEVFELEWLKELIVGSYYDFGTDRSYSSGYIDLHFLPASIGRLKNLEKLILPGSPIVGCCEMGIEDAQALQHLTELRYLVLRAPALKDLDFLHSLKKLEHLDIAHAGISDLTPISNLRRLSSLDISYTNVTSLDPLASLEGLSVLRMMHLKVKDLAPLQGLKDLVKLDMCNIRAKDFSPLGNLTRLNWLCLEYDKPENFEFLIQLPDLHHLAYAFASLPSLAPLRNLEKVKKITVYYTEDTSLAHIQHCLDLEELRVYGKLDDISAVANFKNLKMLHLNGYFEDISAVSGLSNLQNLRLHSPNIRDRKPAEAFKRLEHFSITP